MVGGTLPFDWMDCDGSGLVQGLGNDDIAEGAIQPSHLNYIKALVSPVNVSYEKQRNATVCCLCLCDYAV